MAYWPCWQVLLEQVVAVLPEDYLPTAQTVQPSVFDVAPVLAAYLPCGHDMFEQEVALPPAEKVPAGQISQPSVSVRAPVFAAL